MLAVTFPGVDGAVVEVEASPMNLEDKGRAVKRVTPVVRTDWTRRGFWAS